MVIASNLCFIYGRLKCIPDYWKFKEAKLFVPYLKFRFISFCLRMHVLKSAIEETSVNTLPFNSEYVPEFFKKKAEVELNETLDRVKQSITQIREMIKDDEALAYIDLEDTPYLLAFLRFNKFNVSRTFSHFKIIDNFRKQVPDTFKKISFEECIKGITSEMITFLPWRCPDGCAILFIQLDNWDPEEISVDALKRLLLVYIGQALRNPMTQINGIKIILDVKSSSVKHLRYCTPENISLLYYGGKECAPARYKSINIVNSSLVLKIGWFLIKQFLSEKLKKRVHFHSRPEELLKYFPRSVVPVKYGGDLTSYDMTKWLKDVMEPEQIGNLRGESVLIRK